MSARPDRPVTAFESVLRSLRASINSGELAPGEKIRADEVAASLGVSRVPVREALKTLEGEGVVLYRPRFGYSVTVLDLNELVEMYRMRELLESELMRGVTAFSGSLQRELAESISELASWPSRDVAGCTRINRDFHMALFRGADLPRTFHVIRLLWDMTEPYRALYYADPSNIRRVVTEHQLIVDAIMAGDRAMLIRRLNEHRNSALARLRGVLSRGSGG